MKTITVFYKSRLKTSLVFAFVMLCMQSCDCLQKVEGNVYDAQNMKAISDVKIHKQSQPYESIKTDSSGVFKYSDIDGGRNCSNVALVFEKTGYKSDTISFSANTSGAVVKLSR